MREYEFMNLYVAGDIEERIDDLIRYATKIKTESKRLPQAFPHVYMCDLLLYTLSHVISNPPHKHIDQMNELINDLVEFLPDRSNK